MLLSPFIDSGLENISRNQLRYILAILIIINCVGGFLNGRTGGSDLFGLLVIYLIGRYLKYYNVEVKKWVLAFQYLSALLLLFGTVSLLHFFTHDQLSWTMFRYSNPVIIVAAISLSMFIIKLKDVSNKIFNFLGKYCFAIYLVTEFTNKSH